MPAEEEAEAAVAEEEAVGEEAAAGEEDAAGEEEPAAAGELAVVEPPQYLGRPQGTLFLLSA